jgi:uncharacterized protein (DUF427 family)
VRVEIEGVTLGETRRPILLFETGLPTRYYIPTLDVRMDLLEPTESVTRCPYKGVARYWSARLGDKLVKDIVWSYPALIPECPKIENLLSFYNEHVDMNVDGGAARSADHAVLLTSRSESWVSPVSRGLRPRRDAIRDNLDRMAQSQEEGLAQL